jgi:murein DD-endopeptidase MepM/ murein hydrolase activator NlpD
MTHLLQRTALILTAAGLLTACATTEDGSLRPSYPIRSPEADAATPPAPPPAAAPAPKAAEVEPTPPTRSTPVESQSLAPLAPAQPRPAPPVAERAPPPASTRAPQPTITYETVTKKTVIGKVVSMEGPPATHKVKKGENLLKIAKTFDVSVEDLAESNKLKKPYKIKPGMVLKGPPSESKGYVVGQGDTLFAIARRFGVTAAALAGENEMSTSDALKVGRKIRLPDRYKDGGPQTTTTRVAVEQPAPAMPAPVEPRRAPPPSVYQQSPTAPPPAAMPAPTPMTPPAPTPQRAPPPAATSTTTTTTTTTTAPPPAPRPVTPAPTPAPVQTTPSGPLSAGDAQISQLGRGRFNWPLQGEMISEFGPKAGGQRNDGINIRAKAGETVRAAAAGDVVYAGDQVPGFGNLVLIKHADGWVTAYGHLARIDVKMQQKITQGQQIGQAGDTGGVSEPQLHFEVRYAATAAERARPIDPRLVLPR